MQSYGSVYERFFSSKLSDPVIPGWRRDLGCPRAHETSVESHWQGSYDWLSIFYPSQDHAG